MGSCSLLDRPLRCFGSTSLTQGAPKSATNGVAWHAPLEKWDVRVQDPVSGRSLRLGFFVHEKDAIDIRECAYTLLHGSDYFDIQTWEQEPIPEGKTSRFLGVRGRRGKCMALTLKTGRSLGVFASELEAAASFDKASLAEDGPTNFHPRTSGRVDTPRWFSTFLYS